MTPLAEKLRSLEREMSVEKGYFSFFALARREMPEGMADLWDVVVAAPWITRDRVAGLRYVADRIAARLEPSELVQLSRVVPLDDSAPLIQATRIFAKNLSGDLMDFAPGTINGLTLPEMILITTYAAESPVAPVPAALKG